MAMIQCPHCNAMADNSDPFCPNCGNRLPQDAPAEQPVRTAEPVAQQPVPQQPVPQQPVPQQPVQPQYQVPPQYQPHSAYPQQPAQPQLTGNGPGTAGMVLGIIALVFMLPFYLGLAATSFTLIGLGAVMAVIALVLSMPGLGLSIGGVCRRSRPKGKAVAGLIMNGIVLLAWIFSFGVIDRFFAAL